MAALGVPGTPDGPSIEPAVIGEVAVTFRASGRPSIRWPKIAGRTYRDVVGQAVEELQRLLDGDVLDKLDGDPPREPPL